MKHYKIIFIFLIIVVFVSSSVAMGAPTQLQEVEPEVEVSGFVYTPGVDDPPDIQAITGETHLVTQGTAWVQERPKRFKRWKKMGWGTRAVYFGSLAPADEWVHLPVTMATYIDGTQLYVKHVEFCAQSTNGAVTKPTRLHVRANGNLLGDIPVSWSDNNYHCAYIIFTPAQWAESVGISVKLHFANGTDQITLFKGWVKLVTSP